MGFIGSSAPSKSKSTLGHYNPGQNIWEKVKRYNKIGEGFKNIISNFVCFLTAVVIV